MATFYTHSSLNLVSTQYKMVVFKLWLFFSICISVNDSLIRDFTECHDDFELNPPDGLLRYHNTFTWLGFLQYTHVITGARHFKSAPRVILVQKQFVLGTASDMLKVPYNYKIEYVIFGQYERQESDCGLKMSQAKRGETCGPAYMEIPYTDIYPHPEYSRFGITNSLALMKLLNPLTSYYMTPICLPTLNEREKIRKQKSVFMVDYVSAVPENFDAERMAKKTLSLLAHKDCRRHRKHLEIEDHDGVTHALCTSGCGIRPGAPILSHATMGAFELIGIAIGGPACVDHAMRDQFNQNPPMYIDVYPYVTWIMNVITAHVVPLPYPGIMRRSGNSVDARRVLQGGLLRARVAQKQGWSKRTYLVGNWCFESKQKQRSLHFFYHEKFQVHVDILTRMSVMLKVSAGVECTISCARLLLPNRMTSPKIEGVGGYNITLTFGTEWFPKEFFFTLALTGTQTSNNDLSTFLGERPRPILWD